MALQISSLVRVGRAVPLLTYRPALVVQQRSIRTNRMETYINQKYDHYMAKLRSTDAWKRLLKVSGWDRPMINLGDYPRLPAISNQELPPYGWWDNFELRNKNTIIHESYDSMSVWVYDIYPIRGQEDTRLWVQVCKLIFSFIICFGGLYLALKSSLHMTERDFVAKRFPHGNLYLERGGDATYINGYFPSGPKFSSDPIYW